MENTNGDYKFLELQLLENALIEHLTNEKRNLTQEQATKLFQTENGQALMLDGSVLESCKADQQAITKIADQLKEAAMDFKIDEITNNIDKLNTDQKME